ncbi:membrane dipeptidase [Cryptococcus wingfieldii CBS 7118]|uniref:Dipeptidase n=1 Tax=Cryptococcus wingfieldii CBS 7118 TaxID=1295528 RepID=A0A1E3K2X7_9TREE|nr:membrane dipeptidase [Cryptococcus wingfieldii CBS 7118]ODO07395.1 membrane dipeptidase [Cryptococcus wingfieldii CBS 7118]
MAEDTPLLPQSTNDTPTWWTARRKKLLAITLLSLLLVGAAVSTVITVVVKNREPKDPLERAKFYLKKTPVIDGHIDLPELARSVYGNDLDKFDLHKSTPGHLDIPRLRQGQLGAFFWSMYVQPRLCGCRNTLEQLDVANNIIERYSDTFAPARTADDVEAAWKSGKVASLFGLEGGHSLGNSLGVLRMYHQLGVRYMTLTHSCNNAFADSAGIFGDVEERWGGLSPFGKELIPEMNRLGIFVDISHVSDKTALQALELTEAPVILSHSCARHFNNMSRNAPDEVFSKLGDGKDKNDGVVMVNFFPVFASKNPDEVDVAYIADEVEYIAKEAGRAHVGIGSDYDGIESTPKGLEDVSTYPNLFAELIRRGWSRSDLAGLAGGNVLRALRGVEETSKRLKGEGKGPSMAKYEKRKDLEGGGEL